MTDERPAVLIVGREADVGAGLRDRGWDIVPARDVDEAFRALESRDFDAVVVEIGGPGGDGMALLRRARERVPDAWVVMHAAAVPGPRAVEALKAGAADVIGRSDAEQVAALLERGLAHQRAGRRLADLEERLDERFGIDRLTGRSRAIARVADQIRHVAGSRATVLIEGETGTGKRLAARILHQRGPRRAGPFVVAIGSALGVADGAAWLFGAEGPEARRGFVELAERGTLLIRDIEELPPAMQVRLLRFLQDRTFERVGGHEARRSDARLVATTTRDLEAEVRAGRFREDLFVRLSAVRIPMPPLRERIEDLASLVAALLADLQRELGRSAKGITPGLLERLAAHPWPGNVRELQLLLERMTLVRSGRGARTRPLDVSDLPPEWRVDGDPQGGLGIPVGTSLAEVERRLIEATMRHAGHDKPRAAAILGMGLRTLYRKLDALDLRPGRPARRKRATRAKPAARRGPKPGRRRRR